jgi:hypothetical protein
LFHHEIIDRKSESKIKNVIKIFSGDVEEKYSILHFLFILLWSMSCDFSQPIVNTLDDAQKHKIFREVSEL